MKVRIRKRERERERERFTYVCDFVRKCVYESEREIVYVCVILCESVCKSVYERERCVCTYWMQKNYYI